VPRALCDTGNENLRRRNDLEATGMVLADPGFVIPEPIEMADEVHVAVKREVRVLVDFVERCEEYAGADLPARAIGSI
jgi:hypothetical protein